MDALLEDVPHELLHGGDREERREGKEEEEEEVEQKKTRCEGEGEGEGGKGRNSSRQLL